jgi:hypothetical protein
MDPQLVQRTETLREAGIFRLHFHRMTNGTPYSRRVIRAKQIATGADTDGGSLQDARGQAEAGPVLRETGNPTAGDGRQGPMGDAPELRQLGDGPPGKRLVKAIQASLKNGQRRPRRKVLAGPGGMAAPFGQSGTSYGLAPCVAMA